MGTLVGSHTENNVLLDITVRIRPEEASIYQSLITSDCEHCPHCQGLLQPTPENMHLLIYTPLVSMFGMDVGKPIMYCNRCGGKIELPISADLNAFPSVIQYVTRLRQEYNKRLKQSQLKAKGVIINGSKQEN